jgi:hypothetical protein
MVTINIALSKYIRVPLNWLRDRLRKPETLLTIFAEIAQVVSLLGLFGLGLAAYSYRFDLQSRTSEAIREGTKTWQSDAYGCRLSATTGSMRLLDDARTQLATADRLLDSKLFWILDGNDKRLLGLTSAVAALDLDVALATPLDSLLEGCPLPQSSERVRASLDAIRARNDDTGTRRAQIEISSAYLALADAAAAAQSSEIADSTACARQQAAWLEAALLAAGSDDGLTLCPRIVLATIEANRTASPAPLEVLANRYPTSWTAQFHLARARYELGGTSEQDLKAAEEAALRAELLAPGFALGSMLVGEVRYQDARRLAEAGTCRWPEALARYRAAAEAFDRGTSRLTAEQWSIDTDERVSLVHFYRHYVDALFQLGSAERALVAQSSEPELLNEEENPTGKWAATRRSVIACVRHRRCSESLAHRSNNFRFALQIEP